MSDWDDTFRQLQIKFVKLSEQRLKDMEKLIKRLEQVPPPAGHELAELQRHFHSLKGAGQSYGFPGITKKCKEAQDECQQMLERKVQPSQTELDHWRDILVAVKLELDSPIPTPPGT